MEKIQWQISVPIFRNTVILKQLGLAIGIPFGLVTLLGIGLIFMGASQAILGFAGKGACAVITDIRREGGERTDGKSGRYTYNVGYAFALPDGKEINGFTKKIGDSVYLKADGTSTVRVRYFPAFPYINALEADTGLGMGQVVLMIARGFLILVVNREKRGRQ